MYSVPLNVTHAKCLLFHIYAKSLVLYILLVYAMDNIYVLCSSNGLPEWDDAL